MGYRCCFIRSTYLEISRVTLLLHYLPLHLHVGVYILPSFILSQLYLDNAGLLGSALIIYSEYTEYTEYYI